MHEPAGVVEILVQILQNTPYSEKQFQNRGYPDVCLLAAQICSMPDQNLTG